jgi:hypothetical protein
MHYRYAERAGHAAAMVDEVAALYAQRPLALIQLMTANALERMESRSLNTVNRVVSTLVSKRSGQR